MIGILAEKPSAARNFSAALGGMSGSFHGEQFVIAAARGHLYEFLDPCDQVPEGYRDQYRSWDISRLPWDETLFSWEKTKKKDAAPVLKQIRDTLSPCAEIVIATDVDPTGEGELLAWEILKGLGLSGRKISRMYFADESVKEVQKAFLNRKVLPSMEEDMDYVKAQYRSQWDLLSMQFTRAATGCVGMNAVIRQGRLKSVMVKMTGDGLKAVAEYKREPCYRNKFRDENGVTYTSQKEPKFKSRAEVPQTYRPSAVVKDAASMKHTAPPKLIDLAGLSAKLSSKGYRAKDVLDVYQKMYESQVVSYPRTEDKTVTPEQFEDLLPLVDQIASVAGVDHSLLTHREMRNTHVKTGGAHGANRPGPNVPSSLMELKKYGDCAPDIYLILAKNYLAMLAEDYEYESQKGHVKDYPEFTGTASVPKKMGWKLVYDDEAEPDEKENKKGIGTMASPFIAEEVNKKPPTPTMKWLMAQLEKYDVGTGATRTSTYADVTSKKTKFPLLAEEKGKLSMSPYGKMSYLLLEGTVIGDAKMTEELMKEMGDIAAGKLDPGKCLHKVQGYVVHDMDIMKRNAEIHRKELDHMGNESRICCPVCGRPMQKMDWGYACTGYRDGCRFAVGEICGKTLTERQVKDLVEKGTTGVIKGFKSKSGKEFDAKVVLDKTCHGDGSVASCTLKFDFHTQPETGLMCPACGKPIRKMDWGYSCSGYHDGCRFAIGKICGKMLSVAEVRTLLMKGEVHLDGLVSKSGKTFSSDLCLVKEMGQGVEEYRLKFKERDASQDRTSLMCPACGKMLMKTQWGFACEDYRNGCTFAVGEICGHHFTEDEMRMLLRDGSIGPVSGLKSRNGNLFEAYFTLSEEAGEGGTAYKVAMKFDNKPSLKNEKQDLVSRCPACHSKIIRGERGWECEKHCGIMIPYVKSGREIEEKYAEALLGYGSTDYLEGFISKNGKPFTAAIKLNGKKLEFVFPDWGKS